MNYLHILTNMAIRQGHGTEYSRIGTLSMSDQESDVLEVWTATENKTVLIEKKPTLVQLAGDSWARIERGWVAIVHMNKVYSVVYDDAVNPPTASLFPYYARILHYPELFGVSQLELNYRPPLPRGMPETDQYVAHNKQKPALLTFEIQNWLWMLMKESNSGISDYGIQKCIEKTWAGGRAYCNKAGYPKYPQPSVGMTYTHGGTIKVLRHVSKQHSVHAEFEVLNVTRKDVLRRISLPNRKSPIPDYIWHWKDIPHLIQTAVNWTMDTLPHGRGVAFPGLDDHPVPIPLLATVDTGFIPLSWLKRLPDNTQLPAYPYYPVL